MFWTPALFHKVFIYPNKIPHKEVKDQVTTVLN